jgi:hypothetical protein
VQGTLTRDPLPEVFHSLHRSSENGVLQLTRELVSKHVYFGGGSIVFARSNQHSERLGEFLVRKGRITRSQLADASNKLRASGRRLGAVLVHMGVMSEADVRESVADQMRGMIRPVFSWNAGEYCFRQQPNVIGEEIAVELQTIPTILEGTREVTDRETVARALGDLSRVVSYSKDPWVHSHQVSLTPQEGFVLSRVDGQSSMKDVLAVTPMPEEETLRCLYTLISGGFLEFGAKGRDLAPSTGSRQVYEIPILVGATRGRVARKPAARGTESISTEDQSTRDEILAKHASLSGSTFYDCLGVRRNAKDTEIRQAYLALVRRYHPDRHRSPQLQDLQGALQEILSRAAEAYEALYQPAARQRYDQCLRSEAPRGEAIASPIESPPPAPPTAAEALAARYFREARKFVANREYHEAVKLLEEVVELDPTRAEYHRTLAQALENNPKWRKEAESHFRQAMKLDPFDMESIIGLAHLYWKAGMKQRARPLFALALELDPDNRELSIILRQLDR